MRKKLGIGLLIWCVLEIVLLVQFGKATSGGWVLALLAASALAGRAVLKGQGALIMRAVTGAEPGLPLAGGVMRLFAGVLLIVPGILSDILAVLCLLPLTRGWFERRIPRAEVWQQRGGFGQAFHASASRRQPFDHGAVDGEVIEGEASREPTNSLPPRH